MGRRLFVNSINGNLQTRLTADLAAGGTTANITAGDGAAFAGANGDDWIIAIIRRVSGFKDIAREIVKITNRATDALTIVRAIEGTTALQFYAGDVLDVPLTAGFADDAVSRRVNAMPSDANYTLSETEYHAAVLSFVGGSTLTGTRDIVLPLFARQYTVHNGTTGGQSLRFIGASGTGVTVTNGCRAIIECDGTNFNRVTLDVG